MSPLIETLNFVLSLGGIVLFLCALFLLFDLRKEQLLKVLVQRFGLLLAFSLALSGSLLTLLYSEIFGFIPCGLCWLQRVFLYPQIFLTGTALWVKDKSIALYGIVLSVPGLLVALYQHYLQMGGPNVLGCPAAGEGVNCAERIMFEFGFMTFPLLSAIMFMFLISLFYYIHKTR
ncbi:MAG: disulfide bond formation protein DsbB [Candidatus Azotimanducaceae bacterium]|jgi:disulfide bond formation protein DsbB